MKKTGKYRRGSEIPGSKLTEADVREIRSLYKTKAFTQKALAERFHVSPTRICLIVNGMSWKHVEEDG